MAKNTNQPKSTAPAVEMPSDTSVDAVAPPMDADPAAQPPEMATEPASGTPVAPRPDESATTLNHADLDALHEVATKLQTAIAAVRDRESARVPTPAEISAMVALLNGSSPDGMQYRLRYEPRSACDPANATDLTRPAMSIQRLSDRALEQIDVANEVPSGWPRKAAFAKRTVRLYLGGALGQVLGGELIVDGRRVDEIRSDPSFDLIEIESPEHLAQIQDEYARLVAEVRHVATALGLVVYRDGEVEAPRVAR